MQVTPTKDGVDGIAIPAFAEIALPADIVEKNGRIALQIQHVDLALEAARATGDWTDLFRPGALQALRGLREEAEPAFSDLVSRLPWGQKTEVFRRLRKLDEVDQARGRIDERDTGLGALDGDDFIDGFVPASMALDPVLARGHVAALVAHPNGGKSSIALQMALAVAGLATLPGLDPDVGRVLYLAGDSDTNLAMQLIAAVEQHDIEPTRLRDRLLVVPARFSLLGSVDEIASLAAARGGFSLIVVDTRAAYSAAEQEDDNMQALADAMALRRLTRVEGEPAVLVLCHPAKHAARDQMVPRGGSAFLGEIDENLVLWNDGDGVVELTAQKRRIPEFEPLRWRFDVVDIDRTDSRGRPVRSVRAYRVTEKQAAETRKARRQDENRLLFAMLRHPQESQAEWARQCGWFIEDGAHAGQPHKTKVARLLMRLKGDKLVESLRGDWSLTDRGRREAEKVD